MGKIYVVCCNCGYELGRSADGTQTELRCPRCGMKIEYKVADDEVTVRMIRLYGKRQKAIKKHD